MTVSIMITTKNRSADLRRTCRVLRELNPAPIEVLITADGCTDDTVEVVRAELPEATLIVNEEGRGSVFSRDAMLRRASGELVLALDDDSYPEQTDCIGRIVPAFKENPRLAIACFPQHTDEYPETLGQTDFGPARLTRSFTDSGSVLRRSTYLQLPGFEPRFFHMYEEPDYALQCVAAGYEIQYLPVITIRHHWSGETRSEIRNHHRHSRNEFWSILLRCPLPQMPVLAGYRAFSQFVYACKRGIGWIIREPTWWIQALAGVPYCLRRRKSIRWRAYKRWLQLPISKTGT